MKVAESVLEKIKPLFKDSDIQLLDVEYVKRSDGMHLIVYIDKENGVTVEDCVDVSRIIDQPLDDLNPTEDKPYALDISSYGLDKPLKFDWQFKKYLNKDVSVKLYKKIGELKEFKAVLKDYSDKEYKFEIDSQITTISASDVAYITPYIEF